jgi:uncharacterized membrane protein (DUF2068 family)
MDKLVWFNRSQPQTLQVATILFYITAVLSLITLIGVGGGLLWTVLFLIEAVATIPSGIGLANERKWGYFLALVVAILLVAISVWGLIAARGFGLVINLLFNISLVALLAHPLTRSYRRIWFH